MAQRYSVADFSGKAAKGAEGALTVRFGGREYDAVAFQASWAVNEIPRGGVVLPVGRDLRSLKLATIHDTIPPDQPQRVTVTFNPSGQRDPQGRKWKSAVIFDGWTNGFSEAKVRGKMNVVVGLSHWLWDLAHGSALSQALSVANPTLLNAAAVWGLLNQAVGAAGSAHLLGYTTVGAAVGGLVGSDLWQALKSVFCELASTEVLASETCRPAGSAGSDRAREALGRIEGPGGSCARAYRYAKALPLQNSSGPVASAAADWIGQTVIEAYANATIWDKLVGEFCPAFGLAVLPCVGRALVVADLPAFNGKVWRTVTPLDHDSLSSSSSLERLLQGVGVYGLSSSQVMPQVGADGPRQPTVAAGCYVPPGSKDGTFFYAALPPWLEAAWQDSFFFSLNGLPGQSPSSVQGANVVGPPPHDINLDKVGNQSRDFFTRYAKDVYLRHALRGRSLGFSGRLRFDIAPGSLVRVQSSPERFVAARKALAAIGAFASGVADVAGSGNLAGTEYVGTVSRVTVTLNAEEAVASTAFQLSHVRNAEEFKSARWGDSEHPLFGDAIHGADGKCGAPLVDEYDDDGDVAV